MACCSCWAGSPDPLLLLDISSVFFSSFGGSTLGLGLFMIGWQVDSNACTQVFSYQHSTAWQGIYHTCKTEGGKSELSILSLSSPRCFTKKNTHMDYSCTHIIKNTHPYVHAHVCTPTPTHPVLGGDEQQTNKKAVTTERTSVRLNFNRCEKNVGFECS